MLVHKSTLQKKKGEVKMNPFTMMFKINVQNNEILPLLHTRPNILRPLFLPMKNCQVVYEIFIDRLKKQYINET